MLISMSVGKYSNYLLIKMYFCRKLSSVPVFLRKRDRRQPVKKQKVYTYDRDIICLPQSYEGKDESISIPRGAPTIKTFTQYLQML